MRQPPEISREVTRDLPCLVCGKDHGCTEFPKGLVCRRSPIDENGRPGRELTGGHGYWYWYDYGIESQSRPSKPTPTPGIRKAPPERLHEVYSALVSGLTLSSVHREYLANEGWARHEIQAAFQSGLLASLPDSKDSARRQLVKDLYAKFGTILAEVPGFSLWEFDDGRKGARLKAGAGLLFPVVDLQRRITGLRLRGDEVNKGSRYYWLSSKKVGGSSSGTPPAFYGPVSVSARSLFITEGEKKAMFALQRRPGFRDDEIFATVSVPGHSTFGELLPYLTKEHFDVVVIALDEESDHKKASEVDASRQAIAQHAARQGLVVEFLRWSSEHKGIDDCIRAGGDLVRSTWCPESDAAVVVESAAPESSPATEPQKKKKWIQPRQVPPSPRTVLPTASEARLDFREMLRAVHTSARRRDLKVYVAKMAPGTGKSTAAHKYFNAIRGLTSVYLVSNTANIPADAKHRYLGMGRILPNGQTCCPSFTAIQGQLERGVPHDHLCFDPDCTYRKQKRAPEEDLLTYTAYQTAQIMRTFRDVDLAIIDDLAPYLFAFAVGNASLTDFDDWRSFLKTDAGSSYADCSDLVEILREVLRDDGKLPGNDDTGIIYVHGALDQLARSRGVKFADALNRAKKCFSGDSKTKNKGLGEPIRQRHLADIAPRAFLRELVGVIYQARKKADDVGQAGQRRLFVSESGEWKWYRDAKFGKRWKCKNGLYGGVRTVLWMDADADIDAIKAIFPDHQVEVVDLSVCTLPEWVTIVQDVSERLGKTAQECGPSGARLKAQMHADLQEANERGCSNYEAGFIAHKAPIEAADLPEEVPTEHYWALRSKNGMVACRELFTYGTPQIGEESLKELYRAFWGKDVSGGKVVRPRAYRGKACDYIVDDAEEWADKGLQAMDEYFGAQELRQAIDRIRPLNAGADRPVRITYRGRHVLPYLVDEFIGRATDHVEEKQTLLAQVVDALSTGKVAHNAGYRPIADAISSTEHKVRDVLRKFPAEAEAARAASRLLIDSVVAGVVESAPRTRPQVPCQIVAVTIEDAPTIKAAPKSTLPAPIEPRPSPMPESTPATSPLLAS